MKTSRWVVVAVAVVLISGQMAMASQGRRRSVGSGQVEIEGTIKTPGTTSLVITTSHKDDVTVALADSTVIRHGDTTIAAGDLTAGERVHVKATTVKDTLTATEVIVQDEDNNDGQNQTEMAAAGIVKSVGTDSLVVTTAKGDVTVNVDKNTIIRQGANALTLADIKVGDRVEAEGTKVDDHTLLASHIQVESENENKNEDVEISGVVKSVGASSLVVTTSKGDITVNVATTTTITKQGKKIALADIKTGDRVEAEGTLADPTTLNATKISVEGNQGSDHGGHGGH